jgi:dTDP-4-amino-4,6-dideoxygalactose transaminase
VIRLTIPSIDEADLEAVREVLLTGFLVQGKQVARFEECVACYAGTKHAVAVANCTAALHLALLALEIGPGDVVAVPTYSWPATANVVALCGAIPLFIDIDHSTFNLDPEQLEIALRRQSVKAILPVHAFGGMADMKQIIRIANQFGTVVVEDAACALGTSLCERQAGSFGVMGCFSFHPRKAITTGEGGVVVSNDSALVRRLRMLRNHGQDPDAVAPDFLVPGYNLRMTEFQAALGSSQMAKLERIIEARRAAASTYANLLRGSVLTTPVALPDSRHVYQSYVTLLPSELAPRRREIIARLRQRGIETTIGTYHVPMTTYFRTRGLHRPGDFPSTDDVDARALSLPLYEGITGPDQERVVEAIEQEIGSLTWP